MKQTCKFNCLIISIYLFYIKWKLWKQRNICN